MIVLKRLFGESEKRGQKATKSDKRAKKYLKEATKSDKKRHFHKKY
jgi:hypothetical protein